MEKQCSHCGAALPEAASFCPYCARSVNRRTRVKVPAPVPWRKVLRVVLPLLVVAGLLLGWYLVTRPKLYDDGGAATVTYTDQDGNYQLVLGWSRQPYAPAPELFQQVERDGAYRFPVCLFVHHGGTDANAANAFMNKVERITARFGPARDESGYITYTDPVPHGYCPEAMAVSFVDFLGRDNAAAGTWTITMRNGDVITLHQTLTVETIKTVDYYPQDVAMGTTQELQALIDEVSGTVDPSAVVNLHLPALTYTGELVMDKRPVNLLGSEGEEGRTVFAGTLRITVGSNGHIVAVDGIDFVGEGKTGVGLTAATRVHLTDCTFTGWKTAVLAHGSSWLNFRHCVFADNGVGFHFNASQSSVSHSQFDGNRFAQNDTAIVWEGTPVGISISFPDSVFTHNKTDIDNKSGQSMDISQAVFQ